MGVSSVPTGIQGEQGEGEGRGGRREGRGGRREKRGDVTGILPIFLFFDSKP